MFHHVTKLFVKGLIWYRSNATSHSPPTGTRMSCTLEFAHTRISFAREYLRHICNGASVYCVYIRTYLLIQYS